MSGTAALQDYYGNDCPFEKFYKIYNDGSHYIAREEVHTNAPNYPKRGRERIDDIFDMLYRDGMQCEMKPDELKEFIRLNLEDCFPDYPKLDKYVDENIARKTRNAWQREKRFRRKAYLNRWNYFVTFTYNGNRHTEETFKKKLRKCLSNLHSRRGWCFMGVWERGEETNRLHFHCLMYVPAGQMVGTIEKRTEYSKRLGKMQDVFVNTFFERRFGRNDFEELNIMEMRNGSAVNYILKYLRKTDGRIVYSRGLPTEIRRRLDESAFAAEIEGDYVHKFVIFDNIINYDRDIKPHTGNCMRLVS